MADCVGAIEQLTGAHRVGSLKDLTAMTQSLSRVSSYKDLGSLGCSYHELGSMSRVCSLADFSALVTSTPLAPSPCNLAAHT